VPRAERDQKILKLRAAGQPLQLIADHVGASERTVRRVVSAHLAELARENRLETEQLRARHRLELDGLRRTLAPLLAAADPLQRLQTVNSWLRLQEREARLLGLDAPLRIEAAAEALAARTLIAELEQRLPPDQLNPILDALAQPLLDARLPEGGGE